MEDNTGYGAGSGSPCDSPSRLRQSITSQDRQQGILIQLTSTEGEWDSPNDGCLLFPLERDDEGSLIAVSMEIPHPNVAHSSDSQVLHCPSLHVPLSPSSPGSLGDFCLPAPNFLNPNSTPGHSAKPFANLVKSLSTEVDSKEASLKTKPFLNLVKSISTEISLSQPEVSQSRSDSKLNIHLWRQFTQPKGRNGDSRTAPPSPSSLSPSEPKGGFFKVELEDTRRKFSEAMQEQFSMISKIMGDENSSSPKCQRPVRPCDSSRGVREGNTFGDPFAAEAQARSARTMDADILSKRTRPKPCLSSEKVSTKSRRSEMCTNDDANQSKDPSQGLLGQLMSAQYSAPVPEKWLFALAVLAYGYFTLPLPSYLSGLSLGIACGFLLGLLLILLLVPQHPVQPHKNLSVDENIPPEIFVLGHNGPLAQKGWMNQAHAYDPETHSPSLSHCVYATLEGSWLRLAYPSNNIPRWAAFSEQPFEGDFVSSCRYQLANSKVFLLPSLLARKRLWNMKYPICIVLAEGKEGAEEESTEEAFEGEPRAGRQAAPSLPAQPTTLFLFGRTGREKEEWFQNFLRASMMKSHSGSGSQSSNGVSPPCGSSESALVQCTDGSSRGSTDDIPSQLHMRDLAVSMKEKILLDYSNYMTHFIVPANASTLPSPCPSNEDSPTEKKKFISQHMESHSEAQIAWINALIGRIFWDFLCEKYWADLVARKIQKKLSKIRLPYFMNELTLTELDLGTCMPQVTNITRPSLDQRGLWLELDLVYTGSLQMTLETKMILSRLGKDGGLEADSAPEPGGLTTRSRLCVLADSDEESSSAGSSDEEEVPPSDLQGYQGDRGTPPGSEGHGGGRKSRKILWFVDKITKSKYFQKATENEYIKKMMEEVSSTPLLLTVEVQELSGTLAINIPPPPTDRIWYSFCTPPRLDLRVRPKLGEREVTLTHVTDWIEKKLVEEFQKVFVMPNMDDIYLPLMNSAPTSPPKNEQTPAQPSCGASMELWDKSCQESPPEGE
ncbi:testis-expressed protein 2 isoform X2 [Brienomyrus brachyistius]|uniref:testis-expressed protein 2 isoform X2 n=1 Tax=Brienomyrus brachyistius TaxID=42636 RepID=UPI0020B3C2BA|nr:testis-expressed protein 2 isoform X2 [Brienomyrus brachyistius]